MPEVGQWSVCLFSGKQQARSQSGLKATVPAGIYLFADASNGIGEKEKDNME